MRPTKNQPVERESTESKSSGYYSSSPKYVEYWTNNGELYADVDLDDGPRYIDGWREIQERARTTANSV